MSVVRVDEKGIFVITNGGKYRPGRVRGYCHAYEMGNGGLMVGDRVIARHMSQSPLARVKLPDGRELVWHVESDYVTFE